MLAQAAGRLGFDVAILEPRAGSPAARVAAHEVVGAYDDPGALARLAELSDVITFEFENVPAKAVEHLLALGAQVAPNARALAIAQDRAAEKSFLAQIGVPTVAFAAVDGPDDAVAALERLGAPAVLKTRREGYDGKGQAWVTDEAQARGAITSLAAPCVLEAKAAFVRELSVIAARGRDGRVACYPLGENHHREGILRTTLAPAQVSAATADQARTIAHSILSALDYVGVMGVELFELAGGALLVNEIAPRVHNSGHWTQDGCEVDQFEQHIRAVAGWPLGSTQAHSRVEMTNLIGADVEAWRNLAAEPAARLHLYGKGEARPGRKMGHVNRVVGQSDLNSD
ncbi:MAG: phosphoribosylaminoimidazole carboxylase [Caulobacteraceae bacterium]|nr:phosphoribosylaminoimidazole carboxylase [Caulobacteraceae bacterium]